MSRRRLAEGKVIKTSILRLRELGGLQRETAALENGNPFIDRIKTQRKGKWGELGGGANYAHLPESRKKKKEEGGSSKKGQSDQSFKRK